MVTFSLAYYENYTFPAWADALGWMMGLATLVPMPVFAIYSWKTGTVVSVQRSKVVPSIVSYINEFMDVAAYFCNNNECHNRRRRRELR